MTCGYCGTPLEQREGEETYNFKRRKTCDKSCGAKLREIRKGRK